MKPLLWLLRLLALLPALVYALEWLGIAVPYVRLARPPLAIPLALLLLWLTLRLARFGERRTRGRALVMTLLTGLAATAAAFTVVGVELGQKLDRLAVIVAVDRSRSIDLVPSAGSRIQQEIRVAEQGMRDGDRIGTLAFGADAMIEDPLRERRQPAAPQRADVSRDGTDLGVAIRRALSEVPPDSAARIVLLSDGMENEASLWAQVEPAIKAAGTRVSAIALGTGADQVLLQEIASETNGDYYYVDAGTLGANASAQSWVESWPTRSSIRPTIHGPKNPPAKPSDVCRPIAAPARPSGALATRLEVIAGPSR